MNGTPCDIFLGEFRKRSDIQIYFKNIINNAIENLEKNISKNKIYFEADKINNFFEKNNSKNKGNEFINYISNDDDSDDEILEKNEYIDEKKIDEDKSNFYKQYISILEKKSLMKLIEENKNDKDICDYLNSNLSLLSDGENIFSNERLLNSFNKFKNHEKLLYLYQHSFMIVINFIEQIIKNIFENIHSIPYSIKCLCKFISDLITIKFPSINIPQKSKFISKFFFEKLLIPILIDPGTEAFVNIFISENSYYNLKEISSILKKYVS